MLLTPSFAVSTPTVVPVGELAGTIELLSLIVIMSLLSARTRRRSAPNTIPVWDGGGDRCVVYDSCKCYMLY